MRCVKFYIGARGVSPEAFQEVERVLVEAWGGFTVYTAEGGWRAPDGRVVREQAQVYEALVARPDGHEVGKAREYAERFAEVCSQESVYYTVQTLDAGGEGIGA